jgi:hypothetical protein
MADRLSKFCDFKVKRGRKESTCGQPVPNDEPTYLTYGTTRFGMDLCEEHVGKLEDAIGPFTSIASDAQKRTGHAVRKAIAGKGGKAFTAADVRQWFQEQGRDISSTGRLPEHVIREYMDAHK